jgi:hypothetical protein
MDALVEVSGVANDASSEPEVRSRLRSLNMTASRSPSCALFGSKPTPRQENRFTPQHVKLIEHNFTHSSCVAVRAGQFLRSPQNQALL